MEVSEKSKFDFREYIRVEIYENKKLSFINKIKRKYFIASYNAVYLIRLMQKNAKSKIIGRHLIETYIRNKLIKRYGIFVHPETKIGLGFKLPHPNGVIIGKNVCIGENCIIYQQVTIGSASKGDYLKGKGSQPIIGDDVILFAGCKVIGNIHIANKTIIGANAVVTKSTESNSSYAGIPAKLLKHL